MPSVTDLQQQSGSSNTPGKSTPPLTQQTTSVDVSNADPLTQAIMMLEKKQRNLGKRKVKFCFLCSGKKTFFFSSGKIGKLSRRSNKR